MRIVPAIIALSIALPAQAAQWQLQLTYWQDATLEEPGTGSEKVERRETLGAVRWPLAENHDLELSYAYQPILIRKGEPASNGHLHRLDLGYGLQRGATRLEVETGLHVSSNMFKERDLHSDTLVATFLLEHAPGGAWLDTVGLAGDYRFDGFRLYPRLGRGFDLGALRLAVTLPVEVALEPKAGRWRLRLHRYGEKWGTLDREREQRGRFYISEWRAEAGLRLEPPRGPELGLGLGVSFDSRARFDDLERGTVTERLDPALFAAASLHW